jgi:hypothetical protein
MTQKINEDNNLTPEEVDNIKDWFLVDLYKPSPYYVKSNIIITAVINSCFVTINFESIDN